jgi:hypothetical protein
MQQEITMGQTSRFPAIYGIFVGVLMLAQWAFFLANGQVPELQTEPWRIAAHLLAEFVTALGLMVASIALLMRAPWAPPAYLVFAGMLIYSVIASPGYFAQQGQWALVAMFAVLLVLAVLAVFGLRPSGDRRARTSAAVNHS